ncbi:D-tyrosyl-tRNA(Tyr) deacylase [Membranicola marinus]|uniref:D-aminoacyl-tRNA deacylase n=1 Tax=Membranihabitans marinus TaxID=1227546 RepID=A0A953L6Y0_9BACT|nr:D-aminoacyl-tRNA deacylase [Membranihabitans marinus]MBY5958137.1 D-tyrosyl-tRNA(Tyr) deacylase [Membranihabitans marinus]
MRVVIQRVSRASVEVEGNQSGAIEKGLCVFLGVQKDADEQDLVWLTKKIINLRIFNDASGKMNLSVLDVNGDILLISQFTLHASTRKGNRPSFIQSERPSRAEELYNTCIGLLEQELDKPIQTGVFGGDMKVFIENDGPVTILMDSQQRW